MRRTAFETWSYATDGVMSDYLITQDRDLLAGTYQEISIKKFDAQFPNKIASYYEKARDNHLFLSVVQRDPQINRSTESMLNANDLGLLRVTKETSDGIDKWCETIELLLIQMIY
ncbi:4-hydroxyphenylacetate 3-hydroxylase N-terminal domain-containing protein [Bacillus cereus]